MSGNTVKISEKGTIIIAPIHPSLDFSFREILLNS